MHGYPSFLTLTVSHFQPDPSHLDHDPLPTASNQLPVPSNVLIPVSNLGNQEDCPLSKRQSRNVLSCLAQQPRTLQLMNDII